MRFHTNTLYPGDFQKALRAAVAQMPSLSSVWIEVSQRGSRSHDRAYEVRLGSYDRFMGTDHKRCLTRRFKNSGQWGAESIYAATYDEHGWWMRELFDADPELVLADCYNGRPEFEQRTRFAFSGQTNKGA